LFLRSEDWRVKTFHQWQENRSHLYPLLSDSTFCWHTCTQPTSHKSCVLYIKKLLILYFVCIAVTCIGYMYKMYNIACYINVINKNNNSLNPYPILRLRCLLHSTSRQMWSLHTGERTTTLNMYGTIRPRSTLAGAKTNSFFCRA
jgi:hypothetical protein